MDVEYSGDGDGAGDDPRKRAGGQLAKGRRTVTAKYVRNACGQCRKAKAKCDGTKPICERCQKTGHECNWSTEDARRPLTRDHERALKNQNALLRAEVERLGRELSELRLQVAASTSDTGTLAEGRSDQGEFSSPGLPTGPTSFREDMQPTSAKSSSGTRPSLTSPTSSFGQQKPPPPSAGIGQVGSGTWGNLPVDDLGGDAKGFGRGMSDNEGVDVDSEEDELDSGSEMGSSDEEDEDSDGDLDQQLVGPTKTLFNEHDDLHQYGLTSVFRLRKQASIAKMQHDNIDYDSVSSSPERPLRAHRDMTRRSTDSSSTQNMSKLPRKRGRRRYARNHISRGGSPERAKRHVLLIGDPKEEAWKGCDCQSDCWSRWLPNGIPLTRREHDILLDRLFMFFTSWCMRAIPDYFLRDMYTYLHPAPSSPSAPAHLPKLAHYSPLLHNCMLAVATAFSSDPTIRSPTTRQRFADEAKAYIEIECSRPNISTVQALGLFASYYSGQGQQTLGFMYFGMSARIAQALGLCADCAPLLRNGRLRPSQVLDRAWAFHMGVAQDACWSLYVGRECGFSVQLPTPSIKLESSIHASGPNVEALVSGCIMTGETGGSCGSGLTGGPSSLEDPLYLSTVNAGASLERLDCMTWRRRSDDETEFPRNNMFTAFMRTCQIMKISRLVMELMNRLSFANNGTEIKLMVADIDIQLDAWRQDLPPELKLTPSNERHALPHKLMMHAAFWWQRILLHRPFYQRHRAQFVDSGFSVARCDVAAKEIGHILRLWRDIYGTVRYAPITLIQAIFAAGTVHILQSIQASEGRRHAVSSQATALDNLEELIVFLKECEKSWECASRIAVTFEKLLREHRRAMEQGLALTRKKSKRKRRRGLNGNDTVEGDNVKGERLSAASESDANHVLNISMYDNTAAATPAGAVLALHPISEAIAATPKHRASLSTSTSTHFVSGDAAAQLATQAADKLTNAQQPSYPTGINANNANGSAAAPNSSCLFSDDSYASASDGGGGGHYFSASDVDIDIDLEQTLTGGLSAALPASGVAPGVADGFASEGDVERSPFDISSFDMDMFGGLGVGMDLGGLMDMDIVMPGMRLIDPASLALSAGNIHMNGLGLGHAVPDSSGSQMGSGGFGSGSNGWNQAQSSVSPTLSQAEGVSGGGQHATAGSQSGHSDMGFISDSDYNDSALYDILTALNNASHGTFG